MGLSRRKFTYRIPAVKGEQAAVTASYNLNLRFHLKKGEKKKYGIFRLPLQPKYLEVEGWYVAIRPLVAGANAVCRELQGAKSAGIKLDPLPVFQRFPLLASAALGNDVGKATGTTLHFVPYLYVSSPN